jgi:phosphomannomutase
MGLLLIEIIASSGVCLNELVTDLLKEFGPAFYQRTDLRLNRPVSKMQMTQILIDNAPARIGGEAIVDVLTLDGVKYLLSDGSWLLVRPSGTEPVLRVYAEGSSMEMVQALLGYGESVASSAS